MVTYDIPILIGRDDARRLAETELAKAKYGGTPGWVDRGLDRIERIAEWFLDLLAKVATGPVAGGGINWGFLIAITLLLVAVAVVVWRIGLPRWRRRSEPGAVETDPALAPTDYRARAEALASAGEWREALRDRFRAVVRELETTTIVDVRPARTALEAAADATPHLPELAGELFAGAEEFNAVVFGDRPADESGYRRMVALDDAVLAAAGQVDFAADARPAVHS
jgi:hypothetical protein